MPDLQKFVNQAFLTSTYVNEEIPMDNRSFNVRLISNDRDELDGKIFWGKSEIVSFYCDNDKKRLYLECMEVPEAFRRKGIGSKAFDLVYGITAAINQYYLQQDSKPLKVIYGELSIADSALGEFEMSVPFYRKQAERLGLPLRMYEKDDYDRIVKTLSSESDFDSFIQEASCGCFEYFL